MYSSPSRRTGDCIDVGTRARRIPVDAHQGSHWDHLRRLVSELRNAAQAGPKVRNRLARQLLQRAADTRNIRCAIDMLFKNGDTAGGLDGVRLRSLSRQQRRYLLKVVSRAIRKPYYPEPRRQEDVPKENGTGTRPIEIADVILRIIERALYQVLGPFLDHLLGPHCFGSRPRVNRETAIIAAQHIADRENRHVWIMEDLANAFTMVPIQRLRHVLLGAELPKQMVEKVLVMLGTDRQRGIPQGSPLSGLLLNLYLLWTVVRPWKRKHPTVPLLWVVDDLLLLAGPDDNAAALYRDLKRLVTAAGMRLKGTQETAICHLDRGQGGEWLGYGITRDDGQTRYHVGEKALRKLRYHLERCHEEANPPQVARDVMIGWLGQAGAAYGQNYAGQVYALVTAMAQELGFWELLSNGEFLEVWRQAHIRFRVLRKLLGRVHRGFPGGFALQDPISANSGRGGGDSVCAAPPPIFCSSLEYRVWTDGSSLDNPGVAGWAYHIEDPRGHLFAQTSGSRLRATNNRMELLAVVLALQAIPEPASVQVFTDSQYVERGLRDFLPRWLAEPSEFRTHKNGQLWLQLAEQCQRHRVRCTWTPGHSGNTNNDLVDHLARNAAMALSSLPGGTQ